MPHIYKTPAASATLPTTPQRPLSFSRELLVQGTSRRATQVDDDDVGLVVGVVEETRTAAVDEVEEIPRTPWSEEYEVPLVRVKFRIGCIDADEDTGMFDGEIDHADLKEGKELAIACLRVF